MLFQLGALCLLFSGAGTCTGISIAAIVERLPMWRPYGIIGLVAGALLLAYSVFSLFRLFIGERNAAHNEDKSRDTVVAEGGLR